jgi:hypothetical protein
MATFSGDTGGLLNEYLIGYLSCREIKVPAALALVALKDLVDLWIIFQDRFLLGLQVPLTSKAVSNAHANLWHIVLLDRCARVHTCMGTP